MNKFRVRDFLFVLFVYLAVAFFPLNLFPLSEDIILVIQIGLRVFYLVFLLIYLNSRGALRVDKFNPLYSFVLIPCFVVCFSNLIVGHFFGTRYINVDFSTFYIDVFFTFLTVACEELVFRLGGFKVFKKQKPFYRILFTSLIFGAAHLFNLFSIFGVSVLIQALYTFGIGLILGLMYEYGGNIVLPILFHLSFNVFNNDLFEKLYIRVPDLDYYVINILAGIFTIVYCLSLYLAIINRKKVE